MRKWIIAVCMALVPLWIFSQDDSLQQSPLPEITIKAFDQDRKLLDVPAAVNYIGRAALTRFNPTSIVMAVNNTPGVRMEERSPGSYRFNIRGSSLRSPFGVRNVKVYYNDIPITDPGGHTYLNQLGYYNFSNIEIIKGPSNSIYGAGTGGVLLIESLPQTLFDGAETALTYGSFHTINSYAAITNANSNKDQRISLQHQQSDGYRNHAELRRDVLSWNGRFRISDKNVLKTSFLYGHLFYETPSALTAAEFSLNPKASRPRISNVQGAEEAKASVAQKQFIAGASYHQKIAGHWSNKSVLYGMFTEVRNPTLQNYSRNSEPHVGGRTSFNFSKKYTNHSFSFSIGGEWQQGFASVSVYNNHSGQADSLRTFDEINNRQALIFAQSNWENSQWLVTAGISSSFLQTKFQRFTPNSPGRLERNFDNQLAPRLAIMKKFAHWNIYSSIAGGFSPPSTSELLPSGGAINLAINPEQGINYDLGVKGSIAQNFYFDINAFAFSLENTIVQRRNAAGGDYYINAGKTSQKGIETTINVPLSAKTKYIGSQIWISHTWHHFRYKEFKQLTTDFSGNKMPAVAPHTIAAGIDATFLDKLNTNINYYYSGTIPLNDANTAFANPYHLLAIKLSYNETWKKFSMKLFAGVENLLNETYSLGNDVNGFGGRYYNAAAGRNFYTTLQLQWRKN